MFFHDFIGGLTVIVVLKKDFHGLSGSFTAIGFLKGVFMVRVVI